MYKKLKKKIREIHDYRTLKHSGVFDREYYLKNNLDVARSCLDPIKHYIRYGWREGRNPNSLFDTVRYLKSFPEIVNSDLNPLCHYILNDSEYNCFVQPNRLHGKCKFPDLPPKPMVSIVIVNLNGEEHLRDLLISINLQDYKNYELVFVDNNSSDNSINIVNEYFPKAKIIINNENLGFADGNNIGFNNSVGELVAFINNDTKVDSHWLSSLVSALEKHSDAAVACPKILFWTKFLPVSIRCSKEIELDYHTFFEHLDYKKAFIQSEHHPENGSLKIKNRTFDILIPCLGDKIKFRIRGTGNSISSDVEIFLSQKRIGSYQIKGTSWDELLLEVDLSAVSSTGSYVINNAGSTETSSGDPCDRGYGELDNGKYNTVESIPLLCGCSFVIRRIALKRDPLFVSDFFAYYEDTELSKRITKNGHTILYVPQSVVWHKHAQTSEEKSARWRYLVNRNRTYYELLHKDDGNNNALLKRKEAHFNHLKSYYSNTDSISQSERDFGHSIDALIKDVRCFSEKIRAGKVYEKKALRFGIYNSYWNTYGGGEVHALMFAEVLQKYGYVDLISENVFNIDELQKYFSVNLNKCRRRIEPSMNMNLADANSITSDYDLFINSTYLSKLPSRAKQSYYIVSFPSRWSSPDFIKSYHFLPNSKYTDKWCNEYWGHNAKTTIVYPCLREEMLSKDSRKEKIILSVGRFFTGGHNKKQLEMAELFVQMQKTYYSLLDWQLVLVGSLDFSNREHVEYANKVQQMLEGYNAKVFFNVPIEDLVSLYGRSSIYWHLCGIGEDLNNEPDKFEHFGMTVLEAIANKCYPIVYNAAGPREIIEYIGYGSCFSNSDELLKVTENTIELEKWSFAKCYRNPISGFYKEKRLEQIDKLLAAEKIKTS